MMDDEEELVDGFIEKSHVVESPTTSPEVVKSTLDAEAAHTDRSMEKACFIGTLLHRDDVITVYENPQTFPFGPPVE